MTRQSGSCVVHFFRANRWAMVKDGDAIIVRCCSTRAFSSEHDSRRTGHDQRRSHELVVCMSIGASRVRVNGISADSGRAAG